MVMRIHRQARWSLLDTDSEVSRVRVSVSIRVNLNSVRSAVITS